MENIEKILENKKQYHLKEVELIEIAIAAIVQETQGTKRVQWTSKIKKILDDGIARSPKQIRNKLIEDGTSINKIQKESIYTIISRLKKNGLIKKTSTGQYQKVD